MAIPGLSFFPQETIEAIHQDTLRILDEVGIVLAEPHTLEVLTGSGCRVEGGRIRMPPALVTASIAQAGKRVAIRGRGGSVKDLGNHKLFFHNLGGAPQISDPLAKKRRPALLQDVMDAARLLDALDHCHTITPFFTPTDVPGKMMALAMYRHTLPHTEKPVQGPGVQFPIEVDYILRMAEVLGLPSDHLTMALSPVSPLSIPDHEALAIRKIAESGVAFAPLPCPTAGTTAPLSITGALTQQNAEVLAAVVLAELIRPGLPIIYCGRLAMMEPRTGLSVWGGVEMGMASAATVLLAHFYGFPANVYGFSTNSHHLDVQNGFERAINAILPALAGADELSGIGEMEAGVMGSYAQMVIDNELAGSVLRVIEGITPDIEAFDVIKAVVSSSRNFLAHKHTIKTLRAGEIELTKLAERGSWEQWNSSGWIGMAERAQSDAERILREHQVAPLHKAQETELDRIYQSAEREL
jgi:trimethylamine--corrinoid protein Co-methyltransferase